MRQEVLRQLTACQAGQITEAELLAAKEALRSSLLAVHDSPGSMENFYASAALSGLPLSAEEYMAKAQATTAEQVAQAASQVRLHSVFFLKGVGQ